MTLNEYQRLASRTIPETMGKEDMKNHALHGLSAEVGEIHGLYQKVYQGHSIDRAHLAKEIGDVLWFVAELCTAIEVELDEVADGNIIKLLKRYPNGFEDERSLHRAEGDV